MIGRVLGRLFKADLDIKWTNGIDNVKSFSIFVSIITKMK